MQAVVLRACGPPDVLQLEDDYPLPRRKPGQVLVRVASTSVNPVDTYVRAGVVGDTLLPKILGGDVAGTVVEADDESKFKPGDAVAALTPDFFGTQSGCYAQYVAVEEAHLAALPSNLPADTAGGLPLVGLTAWQAIMQAAPHQGQRLLVLAASGGVGHMAVQIGKALGMHVVGVAGPANTAWLTQPPPAGLGADEAVDYTSEDFAERYKDAPFDVVVDALSDATAKALSVLKPSGHYSQITTPSTDRALAQRLQEDAAAGKGPGASLTLVTPNGAQLAELFALVEAGQLRLEVAKVLPLSQAAEGHKLVESKHTRGKVVLQVP